MKKLGWFRGTLLVVGLAVAAVFMAPIISADSFRPTLEKHLEDVLRSPVEIGKVQFTLWGGPGFRIANVEIADSPDISAEPFAYVTEVRLRLALESIWKRSIVVSRITLVQPSLNIAKGPGGAWNYQRLLRRSVGNAPELGRQLPELLVESGRINFRDGLVKSVYYFRNADLRIADEGIGGDARVMEFRAEPARTDSYAPRFGSILGKGRWRPEAGANGELDLDVGIERSPIGELASLLGISRVGLSGYATARAHLSGPAEKLNVRGSLEMQEQSDWTAILGRTDGRAVALEGEADLTEGHLLVQTVRPTRPEDAKPFQASFELFPADAPESWRSSIQFQDLPAGELRELLQRVDDSFPQYPDLQGSLTGQIDYRSDTGLQGSLHSEQLSWIPASGTPFTLHRTDLHMDRSDISGSTYIRLDNQASGEDAAQPSEEQPEAPKQTGNAPVATASATNTTGSAASAANGPDDFPGKQPTDARLEFAIDRGLGRLNLKLTGDALQAKHFAALNLLVPDLNPQPALLNDTGWTAKGTLLYERAEHRARGIWQSHTLQIRNLSSSIDGLTAPVVLDSASFDLRGDAWRLNQMSGRLNQIRFRGDASHQPNTQRPYQLRLNLGDVDLEALDKAIRWEYADDRGFLRRTFSRSGRTAPAWLRQRALFAKINTTSVLINEDKYANWKGDLYWDGENLDLRNISFRSRFGLFHGIAAATLGTPAPNWNTYLQVKNESWGGGALEMNMHGRAQGGFAALFGNIERQVELTWQSASSEQEAVRATVRANLNWRAGATQPEHCERCVELRNHDGVWLGSCNESNSTVYRCQMIDPQTEQPLEMELPIPPVGSSAD